ncbi:MAG: AMP-binding protein [Opitutales bacterium]|nr:AMP-binding protein [Opitutales bacterium]
MTMSPDPVWIRRPTTDRCLTYGDLLAALAKPRLEYAPAVCPRNAVEAVWALGHAMALDRPLMLYDPLFTEREREALGATPEVLAAHETVAGIRIPEVIALHERVRAARNFRLTLFTSGSTGLPKSVTHGIDTLARSVRISGTLGRAVWALCYNPTHMAGVQVILQAFFNRNTIIDCFGLEPERVVEAVVAEGVTHISATPSFYRLLPLDGDVFDTVQGVTLGGERADTALMGRLRRAFPCARIRNVYASTEAGSLLAADGDVFSIPPALAGRVRIRGDRLEVHRSLLGEGPLADPAEEWYDTGDVVEWAGQNPPRFRILRRDRDWVNVGGEKVDPAEVAEVLRAYPGVTEARVFARPNSVLGQILCAEVVAAPGTDEAQLREHLARTLHAHKIPRLIRFVDALPLTRTGKAGPPSGQ